MTENLTVNRQNGLFLTVNRQRDPPLRPSDNSFQFSISSSAQNKNYSRTFKFRCVNYLPRPQRYHRECLGYSSTTLLWVWDLVRLDLD